MKMATGATDLTSMGTPGVSGSRLVRRIVFPSTLHPSTPQHPTCKSATPAPGPLPARREADRHRLSTAHEMPSTIGPGCNAALAVNSGVHRLRLLLDAACCRYAFRRDGYNALGYDDKGQHKDGYKSGYDKWGFDAEGHNKEGFNRYC